MKFTRQWGKVPENYIAISLYQKVYWKMFSFQEISIEVTERGDAILCSTHDCSSFKEECKNSQKSARMHTTGFSTHSELLSKGNLLAAQPKTFYAI
jgi:hypothetical protein